MAERLHRSEEAQAQAREDGLRSDLDDAHAEIEEGRLALHAKLAEMRDMQVAGTHATRDRRTRP